MGMTYSFGWCGKCHSKTAHCKPSAQAPHYCMRHEADKIRNFDIAEKLADIRSMIKPFASWTAVSVGRN